MGDDFDLFPKRENLDPFSFGKKDTKVEPDKAEEGDELFGQEEPARGPLPDLPEGLSPDLRPEPPPTADSPGSPGVPDHPPLVGEAGKPAPAPVKPPSATPPAPPPPPEDSGPDLIDSLLAEGPISEEKTFDEPVFEQEQLAEEKSIKRSRKSPSPFVVVGGALIIIIGLLYGALTYLKRDKPAPGIVAPPVSVAVVPSRPEPAPPEEPEQPAAGKKAEAPEPAEGARSGETAAAPAEPEGKAVQEVVEENTEPGVPVEVSKAAAAPEPSVPSDQAAEPGVIQYSVQVGAFILKSSVAELEKKLRGLGYDPFLKVGSTNAMMNMLTVGPFNRVEDARTALSRLKEAGVDSNMRRLDDGGAVINAGSYLLEENATTIMRKIRSLGYPVNLYKKEARLPMTFVRVGRYSAMSDASGAREELKSKGLDGIVVKLQ